MKSAIILFSLCILQVTIGQTGSKYKLSLGPNIEYSFSGDTNVVIAGPVFTWEAKEKSKFRKALDIDVGLGWCKNSNSKLVTSACFYTGKLPGIMFGISSQQYYNMETKFETNKTDIRLSGEIIFAYFGFIGYRYQHPLKSKHEAQNLSRHSFFIKFPIPLKKISRK